MDSSTRETQASSGLHWSRINQWLLWLGLAAAVAWLFFRHNEHLVQLLPFLFILACPLMHLFGHRGHRGHGGHGHHGRASAERSSQESVSPGETRAN